MGFVCLLFRGVLVVVGWWFIVCYKIAIGCICFMMFRFVDLVIWILFAFCCLAFVVIG